MNGVKIYTPSVANDLLLLRWWGKMRVDGDLDTTFHPNQHPLSAFYAELTKCSLGALIDDTEGIYAAIWTGTFMDGQTLGAWIAKERRGDLTVLAELRAVVRKLLSEGVAETLLALTCQGELLALHQKLGYHVVGQVEGLWAGRSVWILAMNKADVGQEFAA